MNIKKLFGSLVALAALAGCTAQQPASASLDELFRVLREHDAWRGTSDAKKEEAFLALSELSTGVFD